MKKTLAIALALSLLCILAVGSTMSYLTYTDYDVNTMAVGNVQIRQLEQNRDGSALGALKLLPVVEAADTEKYLDTYELLNHKNVVDKIVTVENTGSEAAYIRTVFAFEMMQVDGQWVNPINVQVKLNVNGEILWETVIYKNGAGQFTAESTDAVAAYQIGTYTYAQALAKDAVSEPSLLQVYLDSSAGNEFFEAVGADYDIVVLSQAVQAAGFADSAAGLNAAFGEVTAENAAGWLNEVK